MLSAFHLLIILHISRWITPEFISVYIEHMFGMWTYERQERESGESERTARSGSGTSKWEQFSMRRVEALTGNCLFELLPIQMFCWCLFCCCARSCSRSLTNFDRKCTSQSKTEKQWLWVGAAVMLCITICSLNTVSSCLSFDPISWQFKTQPKEENKKKHCP